MRSGQHVTEYAPPVIRAASPASSVGTAYGVDQTAFSDSEGYLDQTAFERKWEERLGLGEPRAEEAIANRPPLLIRPGTGSYEEHNLHLRIMANLRMQVRLLEENELYEQTLLRGSQAAMEPQPTTNDINSLMQSMMVSPTSISSPKTLSRRLSNSNGRSNITEEPLNNAGVRAQTIEGLLMGLETMQNNGVTAGKRSRNGSTRRG